MSRGLSRNQQLFVYRHININHLTEYVDSLKSRLYKALVQNSLYHIKQSQNLLIQSPIIFYLSLRRNIHLFNLTWNSFDQAYFILFIMSWQNKQDNLKLNYMLYLYLDIQDKQIDLINRTKILIVSWILEIYKKYLGYLTQQNYIFCSSVCVRNLQEEDYTNMLIFDISNSVYYINFLSVIDRLSLLSQVKNYLYYIFNNFLVNRSINLLILSQDLSILSITCITLVQLILDLYTVYVLYNFAVALKTVKVDLHVLVCHDRLKFLMLSMSFNQINLLIKLFQQYIEISYIKFRSYKKIIKVLKTIDYISFQFYTLNVFFRSVFVCLSLSYQFLLLKQVKTTILRSKSKVPFLIIVRLNKLLWKWVEVIDFVQVRKVLIFLDYLIYVKVKNLVCKHGLYFMSKSFRWNIRTNTPILTKYYPIKYSVVFSVLISSKDYYRLYGLLKLRWIFTWLRKANSRKAV